MGESVPAMRGGGDAPEVEVLLATYNGERFLREQVQSILAQSEAQGYAAQAYERMRVLARDDGSTDGTAAMLAEFAGTDPERFRVLPTGERTGSAKASFGRLMAAATARYVCFADQDDVWSADKVQMSIATMREMEGEHGVTTPLLVFSDLRVVDAGLNTVSESMWAQAGIAPGNIHRLPRLLGQNVVTGCTAMINRPMLELARRMPEEATMHDRWIGLLAASVGRARFLTGRTVLYRQHGGNVVGAAAQDNSLDGMTVRARDDTDRRRERWRSEVQAEALLRVYGGEMAADKRGVLEAYLRSGRSDSGFERVWTTVRYGFFRSGTMRNFSLLYDLVRARSDRGMGG